MIICPNCQHEEPPGALFCSECGARLLIQENLTTQQIKKTNSDILTQQPVPPPQPPIEMKPGEEGSLVSLHLVESGQVIHLKGRNEFTLGRVSEGQPILPDIDLSAFNAYAQGVSRLHVALKIVNQGVVVTDLGSSNGTRVNGQKIVPHVDYPINHGDILAVGKLKIQVLIHK
jgi:pSer/pThr/pTyr-binding forkhead associated (FHA) protein